MYAFEGCPRKGVCTGVEYGKKISRKDRKNTRKRKEVPPTRVLERKLHLNFFRYTAGQEIDFVRVKKLVIFSVVPDFFYFIEMNFEY